MLLNQVTQIPVLAHLGPRNLVEVDGSMPSGTIMDPGLVKYWKDRIKSSSAYKSWWKDRLDDAKVCSICEQPVPKLAPKVTTINTLQL